MLFLRRNIVVRVLQVHTGVGLRVERRPSSTNHLCSRKLLSNVPLDNCMLMRGGKSATPGSIPDASPSGFRPVLSPTPLSFQLLVRRISRRISSDHERQYATPALSPLLIAALFFGPGSGFGLGPARPCTVAGLRCGSTSLIHSGSLLWRSRGRR